MNVYAELPSNDISKGVARVRDAFKRYAPKGVTFVGDRNDSNLVIHHVVGVQNLDTVDINQRILDDADKGRQSVIMQYVYKTTENGGDPGYWTPLWGLAKLVWSYYDLEPVARAGFSVPANLGDPWRDKFYHAPLGVDQIFHHMWNVPKLFSVGTTGYIAETECVREVHRAAPGYTFHLGKDFGLGLRNVTHLNLTDAQVCRRWNECHYIGGLRREEGFELPAAEGLICGARPIMFDLPCYTKWFEDKAIYVKHDAAKWDLHEQLCDILHAHNEVRPAERVWAQKRFDWATLMSDFWRRVL